MKELTPTEIVQWFREQATSFNYMADTVERTFKILPKASDSTTPPLPNMGIITAEKVRELVSKKAMRIATLAKQFNVPTYEVEKIIDASDSGLVKGAQGWITVKK